MLDGRVIRRQKEATVGNTSEALELLFDVGSIILDRHRRDFNPECGRNRLRRAREIAVGEPFWIADERCSPERRRYLFEHSQPFSGYTLLI